MAGFLRSHGAVVGLAFAALAMASLAPGAAGAEPVHHAADLVSSIAGFMGLAAGGSDPVIRMHTDGPQDVVADGEESRKGVSTVLPQQLGGQGEVAIMAREAVQAAAPAPSTCGSTSLTVSLLACVGMALLGLLVA